MSDLYKESVFYSQDYIRGAHNAVPCQDGRWRVVFIPLIPSCWHLSCPLEFFPDKHMAELMARMRNKFFHWGGHNG